MDAIKFTVQGIDLSYFPDQREAFQHAKDMYLLLYTVDQLKTCLIDKIRHRQTDYYHICFCSQPQPYAWEYLICADNPADTKKVWDAEFFDIDFYAGNTNFLSW